MTAAAAPLFTKVLVANRGAVAARIVRALRRLEIRSAAIYSEADAGAPYLHDADEAHPIGPAPARESYLNQERVIAAALACGADAVHPGYGFLSENAEFARRCAAAGLTFVGPAAEWITAMGDKVKARALMRVHGLPVAGGSELLGDDAHAVADAAAALGYPLLVKPAGGGGGIGMIAVTEATGLEAAVERSRSMARRSFADERIYLERLIERPRHVEIQILGDRHGTVRHLFERDCSIQRRHQKVIEESPAPALDRAPLTALAERIVAVMTKLRYDNVGTVEMLVDPRGTFSFLEMNTRLQVEHAVTEMVTGIDLVAAQIRVAAGQRLAEILPDAVTLSGHAVEARIYAEDPRRFLPSPGPLTRFRPPPEDPELRVETGYAEGSTVTPHYDPLLAKLIARGDDRDGAIGKLRAALRRFEVAGVKTNIPFLLATLDDDRFTTGAVDTALATAIANQQGGHG